MDYQKDEQTIFVKDLLFSALYQWRKIVIAALVLGLIGGALGFMRAKGATAPAMPEAQYQEALESYEAELEALTLRADMIQQQKENLLLYIKDSPLMNTDPLSVHCATAILSVQTDYQILPGMTYQNPDPTAAILAAYADFLNSSDAVTAAAEAAGTTAEYLGELVAVTNRGADVRSLKITVKGTSAESVEAALDAMLQAAEAASAQIAQTYGAHTMELDSQASVVKTDTNIRTIQQEALERLASLEAQSTDVQNAMGALSAPYGGGTPFSKKTVVLFAVLGAFLGAFAVAGIAVCGHIASNKLYSIRTLKIRTGIQVLGAFPAKERKCFLDRLLRKLDGRITDPGHMDAVVANVRNYCTGSVLVAGTCPAFNETIAQALTKAGVQAQGQGSLLTDAQTLAALPQCDCVLLVEVCGKSAYTAVAEAMERVADQKKPLLGCVLVDG